MPVSRVDGSPVPPANRETMPTSAGELDTAGGVRVAGRALITSRKGGIAEVVWNHESGMLVDEGEYDDPENYTVQIAALTENRASLPAVRAAWSLRA
jgi:glycosyltransferase involved in cell wall biosynthesis